MNCGYVRVDTEQMDKLDSLLRHVAPSVPEIPYELALDMLRQKYTEFARRTSLLISHYELPLQRDVREYIIEAPEGYEVYGLLDASNYTHGYMVFPNYNRWYIGWGDRFRMEGNTAIVFEHAPSQDRAKCIALRLVPTECADTIPREISVPFGKGIAMGALGDILDMPNKPWYNPRASRDKHLEFNRTIQAGKNLQISDRGAKTVMMKPVRIL